MNKLYIHIILFSCLMLISCYNPYFYEEKIINEYYLVEGSGSGTIGKSVIRFTSRETGSYLVYGFIKELSYNEKYILVKKKYEIETTYYLIDIRTDKYAKDIKRIEWNEYEELFLLMHKVVFSEKPR